MDKIRGGSCKNCDESGHTTMDCPKISGGGAAATAGLKGMKITKDTRENIRDNYQERPRVQDVRHKIKRDSDNMPISQRIMRENEGVSITQRIQMRSREKREMPQLVQIKKERDVFNSDYPIDDEPLTIQVDYKASKKSSRHEQEYSRSLSRSDLRHTMPIADETPQVQYRDTKDLRFEIRNKKRSNGDTKRDRKRTKSSDTGKKRVPSVSSSSEEEDQELQELQDEGVQEVKKTKRGCAITFDSSDDEKVESEVERTPEQAAGDEDTADSSGSSSSSSSSSSSDEAMPSAAEEEEKEEEDQEEIKAEVKEEVASEEVASEMEEEVEEDMPALVTLNTLRQRADAVKREPPTTDENEAEYVEKHKPPNKRSKTSSPRKEEKKRSVSVEKPKVRKGSDEVIPERKKSREPKAKASRQVSKEALSSRGDDKGYSSFSDNGDSGDEGEGGMLAKVREGNKAFKDMPALVKAKAKPKAIVPILPFKTSCRPNQYPESKVPFIDSHCHIDYLMVREQCFGTFASYVQSKEFPKNFSGCVSNFCDPPAWGPNSMYEDILEEDGVWGAFGLHPHNASRYNETIEEQLIKACSHPKCVAWGEMGLDYGNDHHNTKPDEIEAQKEAFISQIKQALRLDKPFVIHGRGAEQDAFEILKNTTPKQHRIHFHCYTGSWSVAQTMMRHFPNMYIGITGLVTYNTASNVREVARKCPLDRILVETDAPYMKPYGARNLDQESPKSANPGMGLFTADKIAEIRKLSLDAVLTQMRENVRGMYGI